MHWTRHPAEKAADVVEKVLLTGGEQWLETGQHTLTWWQNSLLDVYAVIASVLSSIAALLLYACWSTFRAIRSRLRSRTNHVKQS